ncbi:tRNA (N6-isopentenyl adenosine(37)-C2)-methylthiotransferase MiaB [Nitrospina gracilis]|uniref:tRNA (N6-isopentenyl adenosine(37)-C2)-methylthiotransferase MiaB n=1 Tax=Nitrospina gracilis TaxID=35801 RepID=UPI001F03080E|nr:tRNA (N6-isopentenyl adenosine(37)-C2)-methylthiotransferase MiaB [Nitrospina gracilis]MCF8721868.1 tRNA-2-methylthio-N6-dimethylallyladenosine synthase [Nitrospina gracilis Nb-211]
MKHVYLETFGCQMNVADTDRMELLLFHSGYTRTQHAEDADLILVNTCSIRDKAEQKVYSLFGSFRPLKQQNPDLLFGLAGCLAQQEQESLLKRMPFLDFIIGPDAVEDIPLAVDRVRREGKPLAWTEFDREKHYSIPVVQPVKPPGPSAFVNIIKGCDKFCSFCVVPFTRGREKSREASEIYGEVRQLVDQGAREIILLGQNVNAYGKRGLEKPVAFHELLYGVAEIPGVERLRFTTSHPRDFTPETVQAFREIDKLVNHLHLPVQSGNDRILDRMRRSHTVAEYMEQIDALRNAVPDIALSTDIIVGFPGETESEFEDTLRLMEKVGYSNSYMFAYSPRPNTPAALYEDSVPEEEKKRRLHATIDLQSRLTDQLSQQFLDKEVEVLVESRTSRQNMTFKGRNPEYWMVIFSGGEDELQTGDLARVRVHSAQGHVLKGEYVSKHAPATAVSL